MQHISTCRLLQNRRVYWGTLGPLISGSLKGLQKGEGKGKIREKGKKGKRKKKGNKGDKRKDKIKLT